MKLLGQLKNVLLNTSEVYNLEHGFNFMEFKILAKYSIIVKKINAEILLNLALFLDDIIILSKTRFF